MKNKPTIINVMNVLYFTKVLIWSLRQTQISAEGRVRFPEDFQCSLMIQTTIETPALVQ